MNTLNKNMRIALSIIFLLLLCTSCIKSIIGTDCGSAKQLKSASTSFETAILLHVDSSYIHFKNYRIYNDSLVRLRLNENLGDTVKILFYGNERFYGNHLRAVYDIGTKGHFYIYHSDRDTSLTTTYLGNDSSITVLKKISNKSGKIDLQDNQYGALPKIQCSEAQPGFDPDSIIISHSKQKTILFDSQW